MERLKIASLLIILLLGFTVRLYRFDNPIADWHAWRQADTSAVSRNFVTNGFDLLHPRFDDLSNVASGIDNPDGFRFVEFPIYNFFQAGLFKAIGIFTLEQWGRLVTIIASLLSSVFIYLLIKKRFGFTAGFFSAFFFLFLPYNIYFSRVILPDPSMVMASLGGVYFFQKWIERNKFSIFNFQFSIALVFITSAFLLKPYALFFTLPMIYLAYEKFGFSFIKKWQLWIFAILCIIPVIWWRIWMLSYPQGIPASDWLFNGNGIRFRPSFFYWIFYERFAKLILGFWGIIIFVFAIFKINKTKDLLFVLSFGLSSLIYVAVIATGNVQHDYYQILIIPSISIILGLGATYFISQKETFKKYLYLGALIVCIVLGFAYSWNLVKDYFNINNNSIILAGKAVDRLVPKDALVLANYNGDTSFLYQTKRKGWASFEKGLDEMTILGASYLILVNPTPVDLELSKTYKIVEKTNAYVIFDLSEK
ncbi:MAG: hypothetical protein A2171_02970 [Candidatus Levybacteria bacterium RBG_13_35_9]|nr:MAG: hypothetical protein A2171_02970 [Candidatus Levybacteria bacterium RBG_13_35_9]